jgi:hypothetical protein
MTKNKLKPDDERPQEEKDKDVARESGMTG